MDNCVHSKKWSVVAQQVPSIPNYIKCSSVLFNNTIVVLDAKRPSTLELFNCIVRNQIG